MSDRAAFSHLLMIIPGTGTSDGWAKKSPMDCEERLATQVAMTTAASPSTKVWDAPYGCNLMVGPYAMRPRRV